MGHRTPMLVVSLLVSSMGFAQAREIDENVTYGYAQVLQALPVYQTFRARTPERRCDSPAIRDGGDSTAGAVIGGAIGRKIDKNNDSASGDRCRTVEVEREERRLVGYDVEYQYKGEKYMSRMDRDPGNRLRVRVSVVPDLGSANYR